MSTKQSKKVAALLAVALVTARLSLRSVQRLLKQEKPGDDSYTWFV